VWVVRYDSEICQSLDIYELLSQAANDILYTGARYTDVIVASYNQLRRIKTSVYNIAFRVGGYADRSVLQQ